jgi:hypothetical protein
MLIQINKRKFVYNLILTIIVLIVGYLIVYETIKLTRFINYKVYGLEVLENELGEFKKWVNKKKRGKVIM